MTFKTQVIIFASSLLVAFALGRYTAQKPDVTTKETKSDTDVKHDDTVTTTHTTTTTTKEPDGKEVVTQVTDTKTENKETETNKETDTLQQTIIQQKNNKVTVSALGAVDFTHLSQPPAFGAAIEKQLLGPVKLGIFGLNNGVFGVSIGVEF